MSETRWQGVRRSAGWWFGLFAVVWLAGSAVLLAAWWLRDDAGIPWFLLFYAGITVLASLFAFAAYGIDKRRAAREGRRIPERVLHASSLLGGWPGAYLAQQMFRHKTQKAVFRLWFWLIVLLHATCIAYGVYLLAFRSPPPGAS